MNKDHLIIFVKNPVPGKVKTRLAQSIDDEQAAIVYRKLLEHTRKITEPLTHVDKTVFYGDYINNDDLWKPDHYHKALQTGHGLGERMQNAFQTGFDQGAQHIVIIGSDCYELTSSIIKQAFEQLEQHDGVIGPTYDGGYYLLGMNRLHPALFQNKTWSTEHVYLETRQDIQHLGLDFVDLPILNDVDHEEDLGALKEDMHLR